MTNLTAHLTNTFASDRRAGFRYYLAICDGPSVRDEVNHVYCVDKKEARKVAAARGARPWNF